MYKKPNFCLRREQLLYQRLDQFHSHFDLFRYNFKNQKAKVYNSNISLINLYLDKLDHN